MCVNIQYLFSSFWLTSLCVTVSRSIHALTLFHLTVEYYSTGRTHHIFSIHSFVDGPLSCLRHLAVINSVQDCIRGSHHLSETFDFFIPHEFQASQVVLVVKNLPANAGDVRDGGLIPGSERSPEEGNGNSLQYSCPENPMDRGA